MALVQRIVESRNLNRQIPNGWWEKFCEQNLSITVGASISLSQARANATDSELIHNYFDLFQTIMTEHDLLDKPCLILILTKAGSL